MAIWPRGRHRRSDGFQAILHQGGIEVFERLRREPVGIEGDILANKGIIAEKIGNGGETGGTRFRGSEGLEEEERFKGSVRRQRRHPPLPVRSATWGEEFGDRGHGEGWKEDD